MAQAQLAPRSTHTLLHAFPSFEVGGSQLRFVAFANHYGPRYRHLIVAMNGKTQCLDRLHPDVQRDVLDIQVPKNRTFSTFLSLRRKLAVLRPDTLITYNWGAIEWALANIIPICRHVHIEDGFGPEEALSGLIRRRSLFRRLVLSRGSRVVLPSRTLVAIASKVWRLPPQRLSYVPNGIDCARFTAAPDTTRVARLRRQPHELLIGTVATLRTEKNIGRLIEAFAVIAAAFPARLIIIGDGAERTSLEGFVADRGLTDDVVFVGAIPDPERILGGLDVFALSSDTEQMPFSILEAMAAGLPIAAVDVGDVREMVAPDNRPLIVPQSIADLAQAIATLLRDRQFRMSLGQSNRLHVCRHYDQGEMFERYASLFEA
jgi:glycosyltransferase involved in cell wall biosynthesis